MFQNVSIFVSIASIILLFVYPRICMLPLVFLDAIIILQYNLAKSKYQFRTIPELSSEANGMLNKYGHYFAMPFASKDFSASAATSQFAGIILMLFALFKHLWVVIPFAVINWFIMGRIANGLSPASIISQSDAHRRIHDEIIAFFQSKSN